MRLNIPSDRSIELVTRGLRQNLQDIYKLTLKLARSHVAYELNEPKMEMDELYGVLFSPFVHMSYEQLDTFEPVPAPQVLPEIRSRAMQRLVEDGPRWIVTQPRMYSYLTSVSADRITVRFAIREYLA